MNCLEQIPQTQNIVQGEDIGLNVRLVTADPGDPFDLTNASEIVAIFPITLSPNYLEKRFSAGQITVPSAAGGRMVINLSGADTGSLLLGSQISFEVRVTILSKTTTIQFINALNVVSSLFPTAP